jgi:hypothetical protein
MSLTSSSTLKNALDQYNDNLSWDGNSAKAILALEAVRFILVNRPVRADDGLGRSVNYNLLEQEKKRLEEYVRNSSVNRNPFVKGKMLT